jgi:hypothetical protein
MEFSSLGCLLGNIGRVVQARPDGPIIVRIIEPPRSELAELRDVLIGSLGLTGVLVLASLVFALLFAGVLFWIRSRSA